MPARLILNADDFGLTCGINRAIGELHTAGVLTSATLMANGPAFGDAVRGRPLASTLGVGCHIVLTDGTPVSPPSSIRSLLGPTEETSARRWPDLCRLCYWDGSARKRSHAKLSRRSRNCSARNQHHSPGHAQAHASVSFDCAPAAAGGRAPRNTRHPQPLRAGLDRSRLTTAAARGDSLSASWDCCGPRFEAHAQIRDGAHPDDRRHGCDLRHGRVECTTLGEILRALTAHRTYELCCHPGYNDSELDRVSTRLRAHREVERDALLREIANSSRRPTHPRWFHYGNLAAEQNSSVSTADVTF